MRVRVSVSNTYCCSARYPLAETSVNEYADTVAVVVVFYLEKYLQKKYSTIKLRPTIKLRTLRRERSCQVNKIRLREREKINRNLKTFESI